MYRSMTPGWEIGKWIVICDVCGFKKLNTEVRKRWDGLIVCQEDFETRHPQEFIRPRPDDQSVPFTRPEPADTFVDVTYADIGPSGDIPEGTFNNGL